MKRGVGARFLVAAPFRPSVASSKQIVVVESDPAMLFEEAFVVVGDIGGLALVFTDAHGNEIFTMHEPKGFEPSDVHDGSATSRKDYANFLASTGLASPLGPSGASLHWASKLQLPSATDVSDFIGLITETPKTVTMKRMPRTTDMRLILFFMAAQITAMAILFVIFLVCLRLMRPPTRQNVPSNRTS